MVLIRSKASRVRPICRSTRICRMERFGRMLPCCLPSRKTFITALKGVVRSRAISLCGNSVWPYTGGRSNTLRPLTTGRSAGSDASQALNIFPARLIRNFFPTSTTASGECSLIRILSPDGISLLTPASAIQG